MIKHKDSPIKQLKRSIAYRKNQNFVRKSYFRIFPRKYTSPSQRIKSILFELSSRCNLECPFCTNRFRKSGYNLSYEKAVEYCDKLPKSVEKMHLHFSGESFLNPEIPEITKFLSSRGLYLSVSTNGTLPPERYLQTLENGLDQLIFAIDGATAETHEKYRIGSDFEKIMKTLTAVSREKPSRSQVGVQFLVTRFNENEIGQMKDILNQIEVDFFNLKTLSLDIAADEKLEGEKLENAKKFLPKNEKYSRYRSSRSGLKVKYPILICPFIYQPVIGADGEVSLCCIDLEKQIKIGNLNEYDSFEDLWNTQDYRSTRKKVLNKKLSICQKCNYCLIGLQPIRLN